jgi:Fe-S-cluster containining protein
MLPPCPESCKARCCVAGQTLTLKDVRRIMKATGKTHQDFCEVDVYPEEKSLYIRLKPGALELEKSRFSKTREGNTRACIFLKHDYKCALHYTRDAKPVMCSLFPYYPGKCVGKKAITVATQEYARGECPLLGMELKPGKEDLKLAQRFVDEVEEDRKVLWKALGWESEGNSEEIKRRKREIIDYVTALLRQKYANIYKGVQR